MSASAVGAVLLPFGLIIGLLSRASGGLRTAMVRASFLVADRLASRPARAALALNIENYWIGVFVPVIVMALGMAAVVTPADDGGDELGARRQSGSSLGREQRGKPDSRL